MSQSAAALAEVSLPYTSVPAAQYASLPQATPQGWPQNQAPTDSALGDQIAFSNPLPRESASTAALTAQYGAPPLHEDESLDDSSILTRTAGTKNTNKILLATLAVNAAFLTGFLTVGLLELNLKLSQPATEIAGTPDYALVQKKQVVDVRNELFNEDTAKRGRAGSGPSIEHDGKSSPAALAKMSRAKIKKSPFYAWLQEQTCEKEVTRRAIHQAFGESTDAELVKLSEGDSESSRAARQALLNPEARYAFLAAAADKAPANDSHEIKNSSARTKSSYRAHRNNFGAFMAELAR